MVQKKRELKVAETFIPSMEPVVGKEESSGWAVSLDLLAVALFPLASRLLSGKEHGIGSWTAMGSFMLLPTCSLVLRWAHLTPGSSPSLLIYPYLCA